MATGVAALGIVTAPWQLYPAFVVMSVGWGAMSGAAINIMLVPWWERRRGLAVSIAFNGATLGGVLIAPALIPLIGAVGFARALAIAALAQLVVLAGTRGIRDGARPRSGWGLTAMRLATGPTGVGGGATLGPVGMRCARGDSGACRRRSPSASPRRSGCSRIWSRW